MHRSKRLWLALTLGVSAACWNCTSPSPLPTPDAGPSCPLPFLGKEGEAPAVELTALRADSTSVKVLDGDPVAMILPPQGGRVIFAGVRATNIEPCGVTLTGVLRDLVTRQVRVDRRTINLRALGDGWGGSDDDDISSFANVPVCPNQWATADLYGAEYELSIVLTDQHGHEVTSAAKVIPACAEPDNWAECTCICKSGYVLGQRCDGGDQGTGDGGAQEEGGSDGGGDAADGGM